MKRETWREYMVRMMWECCVTACTGMHAIHACEHKYASTNMQAYGNVVVENVGKKAKSEIRIESEISSFMIWQASERNTSR